MAAESEGRHRSGPLKQQNKSHKHGKHKSKGELERDNRDTQISPEVSEDTEAESSIQEWRSDVSKRSAIPWQEKPDKVNLYSQNVIQETDNTDTVDRDSIAAISTTRQHWETKFKPSETNTSTPKPKATQQQAKVRHWEVKLPQPSKQVPADVVRSSNHSDSESDSEKENMADTDTANESAIEREIRLATEREELLRKEQEDRAKLVERQNSSQSTVISKEAFESVSEENNNKPTYHEMTEADRGSELQQREELIQQEMMEQQEREAAIRQAPYEEENSSSEDDENANESIIEREIRQQQEREQELEMRRQQLATTSLQEPEEEEEEVETEEIIQLDEVTMEYSQPPTSTSPTPASTPGDLSDADTPGTRMDQRPRISYEDAISHASHDGESLIARELREAREKEEELTRQRDQARGTKSEPAPVKEAAPAPSVKEAVAAANQYKPTYQQDVSPFKNGRRQSQDSLSSHSTDRSPSVGAGRVPKVTTFADQMEQFATPEKTEPVKQEKQETPIQREIRLARERENEFRVAKGLPPLKDENKVEEKSDTPTTSFSSPRQKTEKAVSRQNFASSRLQKEINKQTALEKKYREEGKVKSTSEDHVGLIKFTEIARKETTPKRNFTIQKKSTSESPVSQENGTPEQKGTPTAAAARTPDQGSQKFSRSVSGSGGVTFSYKESRHKAESKIEQELREMREREEELRSQRVGAGLVSPRDPDSPRSPGTVTNKRSQFEQTS